MIAEITCILRITVDFILGLYVYTYVLCNILKSDSKSCMKLGSLVINSSNINLIKFMILGMYVSNTSLYNYLLFKIK